MSSPLPYLVRMLLFLVAVAAVVYFLLVDLVRVFMNTPALDAVILGVLAIGIFFVFRQVVILWPEVTWIRRYQHREEGAAAPPSHLINLLAPMAAMLGERQDQIRLSPTAARALLDGIATRLDERRELARYMIGLLIFLGLLGTFWGLLQTIGAVADAITNLQVAAGDAVTMFTRLKGSIEGPLKGMSTAFGASLFGLSGSLVLGFLELQASQAQGRFHSELEEWLARVTSISSPVMQAAGGAMPAYVEALLERNAEGTDNLVRALQRVEESRAAAAAANTSLVERLASLAETMRAQQNLLARFTELSIELRGALARLSDRSGDEANREAHLAHQRNIEAHLSRLVEESARSRGAMADEVRALSGKIADRAADDADREAVLAGQRQIELELARTVDEATKERARLIEELRGLATRVADRTASAADREAILEHQRSIESQVNRLAEESTRARTELTDELRNTVSQLREKPADDTPSEVLQVHQRNVEALMTRLTDESARLRNHVSSELQEVLNKLGDQSLQDAERQSFASYQQNIEAHLARLVGENERNRATLIEELRAAIGRLGDRFADSDRDALAAHQRNIEAHLARLSEETAANRTALADELRGEIRLLARTVALGGTLPQAGPDKAEG